MTSNRLLHDAVPTSEDIQHQMMDAYIMIANDELGGTWEEVVVAYFKIRRLRETVKEPKNRSTSRNTNQDPLEFKLDTLPLW